jgi:hypothetical protein
MNLRKIIEKRIREKGLSADVHAVVAANIGSRGQTTRVSSRSTVVQSSGGSSAEPVDGREGKPRDSEPWET